jgi:hypothetical protein
MSSNKVRRITNPRKLTVDEAAEDRRLRELVDNDKSEIVAEGRRLLAARRQQQAASTGAVTLGQKIRAERERRGLTQAELARRNRARAGQ